MQFYKKEFIEFMVACRVLTFGNFTTKSGRQTPFFINTGNYETGEQLLRLGKYYAKALREKLNNDFDVLFGPAYKGIPLVAATAMALASDFKQSTYYLFNRKEVKNHGEGGNLIGHKLQSGERVVIIEDVTTAGTSVRESVPILKAVAEVKIKALIVSVDRMEKGQGTASALNELQNDFGLLPIPIVTLDEIVQHLYQREINGQIIINQEIYNNITKYREQYGAK